MARRKWGLFYDGDPSAPTTRPPFDCVDPNAPNRANLRDVVDLFFSKEKERSEINQDVLSEGLVFCSNEYERAVRKAEKRDRKANAAH